MPSLDESLKELLDEHFPATEENIQKAVEKVMLPMLTKPRIRAMLMKEIGARVSDAICRVLARRVSDDMIDPIVARILEEGEIPGIDDLPGREFGDSVAKVVEHYKTYHPKSRPSEAVKNKIRTRLKDGYTADDLCRAIDGMHKTPHNLGFNDRNEKYLSLELAVRNSDKVTRFMSNYDNPPPMPARKPTNNFDAVFGGDSDENE